MKNREAIETILEFNLLITDLEGESVKILRESLRKAIVALNRQESNIGKHVEFCVDYCDEGLIIDFFAECPTCGYRYNVGNPYLEEPFCPHCGQKLLWKEITDDE